VSVLQDITIGGQGKKSRRLFCISGCLSLLFHFSEVFVIGLRFISPWKRVTVTPTIIALCEHGICEYGMVMAKSSEK